MDRIGKAPDQWGSDEIAQLLQIHKSIKSGESRPDLEFAQPREPGSEG